MFLMTETVLLLLPLLFHHFRPQLMHQPPFLYLFVAQLEFQDASGFRPTGANQGSLKAIN